MINIVAALIVSISVAFSSYGKSLENIKFTDTNGRTVYLSQLKGKPVVLVFWQLYCHACKKELPAVSKIAKQYKGKAHFYAVVIGTSDILQIEEKKREWKFDLPVLIADYKVRSEFGIFGTPITVILDKNLKVVRKIIGSGREKSIIKVLKRVAQE
ncbi:TlpA family protein disulfide reductase [Persephonella atlantica]|uniref:TlpA family protein disulfide reductase n=1 Tax=Persephonella atlantica TaxID=2699429 RepID=A0ABS1GGN7_9AQUI|nr:TlpA disulfide reductase family protein [Persephonella atlantica]MBK3332080.1 TlpA family protein disulfide reductase [Persephonella atlantica]